MCTEACRCINSFMCNFMFKLRQFHEVAPSCLSAVAVQWASAGRKSRRKGSFQLGCERLQLSVGRLTRVACCCEISALNTLACSQSVKNDKDREFYLGHSVKASTGRQPPSHTAHSTLETSHSLWHDRFLCSSIAVTLLAQACTNVIVSVMRHRWQKNKDILWYTRQKGSDEAQQRQDELTAIKAREEELMAEVGCFSIMPELNKSTCME